MVAEITGVDESPTHRLKAAPFIRWSAFETWDAYKAAALARQAGASFRALEAKERALSRTNGPVRYTAIDEDEQLFDQVFAWKGAQLLERREQNRFSVPRNAAFMKELQRRGLLFGASLRVGSELVAGQIWGLTAGRRTAYLPGFHPGYAEHSPGAILQLHFLRDSFDSGDDEVDFMTGDQPYKLAYSTHIRWLATLGREPFIDRARRSPRMVAGKALLKAPGLQRRARQAESALATFSARVRKR
jgi:CelD/BcsL family acetyltransferase involved in cellulose biosynthesis